MIILSESKQRHLQNYCTTYSQNMKNLWSGIKTIIFHESCSTSAVSKIKDRYVSISSDLAEISYIFNDYFDNIADCIAEIYRERQNLL